jgi:hypothetical protein
MRSYGLAARKPLADFIESRAVEDVAQLAEQIVREGHAFERRTCLELAMQVGRYIPDLNHNWHVISILACRTHVKARGSSGSSELTVTPVPAKSCAQMMVSDSTAAFDGP